MKRLVSVLWLATIWVVLWGQFDVRSVVGGLALSTLLVVGIPSRDPIEVDAFRPIAVLRFVLFYAGLVLKSNAVLAWEIITPGSRIREGIVAVPLVGASDLVVSLLAHAIGGTPGTLVVDVDRNDRTVLYIHVLHLRSVEQVRRDILDLERRLVAAVGSDRSVQAVQQHVAATAADHHPPHRGEEESP